MVCDEHIRDVESCKRVHEVNLSILKGVAKDVTPLNLSTVVLVQAEEARQLFDFFPVDGKFNFVRSA